MVKYLWCQKSNCYSTPNLTNLNIVQQRHAVPRSNSDQLPIALSLAVHPLPHLSCRLQAAGCLQTSSNTVVALCNTTKEKHARNYAFQISTLAVAGCATGVKPPSLTCL
jgi:hypothetical protein